MIETKAIHTSASFRVVLLSCSARAKVPVSHSVCEIFLIVKKGQVRVSFDSMPDAELKAGGTFFIEPNISHGIRAISDCEVIVVTAGGCRVHYEDIHE